MKSLIATGAARAGRCGPEKSENGMGRRNHSVKKSQAISPPPLYTARSAPKEGEGNETVVALRPLTEGLLKLEYQLKVWRRQMCRRLDNIDSRLHIFESELLLLKHVGFRVCEKGTTAAEVCKENLSAASGYRYPLGFNKTGGISDEFRAMQMKLAAFSQVVTERSTHKMGPPYTTYTSSEKCFSSAFSELKRVPTADNTPTVTESSGENSDGLTPVDVKTSSALHSTSPPPPTPSFVTMTPVSPQASGIFGGGRCCGSLPVSSPSVVEPHRPATDSQRGARLAKEPPSGSPVLRTVAKKAPPSTPIGGSCSNGLPQSPFVQPPLLHRKLFYSPEEVDAGVETPLPEMDVENTDSHCSLRSDDETAQFTGLAGDGITSQLPSKPCVAGPSPNVDVPSSFPLYMIPQGLYSTDSSVDATESPETNKCTRSDRGGGVFSASSRLAAGSVWHKMVVLAHAEQQLEQLQKSFQPVIPSMISSGMVDVSASTM